MLVADDHSEPDEEKGHASQLGHLECPGYVRHVVEDYVRQWWIPSRTNNFGALLNFGILGHVRNPIMNHSHHKSRQPGHSHPVPTR